MRSELLIVVALIGAMCGPARALPLGWAPLPHAGAVPRSHVVPIVDRPAMRGYQPYSGLQFGFRPEPPTRGQTWPARPEVVAPTPVAPLIEYGSPRPHSAQWYAYCAERFRRLEPRTADTTRLANRDRLCR